MWRYMPAMIEWFLEGADGAGSPDPAMGGNSYAVADADQCTWDSGYDPSAVGVSGPPCLRCLTDVAGSGERRYMLGNWGTNMSGLEPGDYILEWECYNGGSVSNYVRAGLRQDAGTTIFYENSNGLAAWESHSIDVTVDPSSTWARVELYTYNNLLNEFALYRNIRLIPKSLIVKAATKRYDLIQRIPS